MPVQTLFLKHLVFENTGQDDLREILIEERRHLSVIIVIIEFVQISLYTCFPTGSLDNKIFTLHILQLVELVALVRRSEGEY